ncbi:MAG: group III truncated hemoglobin [Saprospiraceae bacterium]
MQDIRDKADIKILVDAFYKKVRIDPIIGAVFAARIPNDDWTPHLERMYSFWHTILFGVSDYRGNSFAKHEQLPIQIQHFERWIALLTETVDALFIGIKAEEVKLRAVKIGAVFQAKLAYIQANDIFKKSL